MGKGNLKIAAVVALMAGGIYPPPAVRAQAQPVRLDNDQARAAAWRALQIGKPALTLQIASAMAKKTPDDFELIFLQAQALLALDKHTAAAAAARHAFQKGADQGQRFDAAHLVAKAYFAKGASTRAQFWLRRATQIAPDQRAKSLSKRDFKFIRRGKKLSTKLFFSMAPTSNINNGAINNQITVLGLPLKTAKPHSGTALTAGFETSYTHKINARTSLRLGLFTLGTTYKLSSAAKALDSGQTGSDFAFATVEARLGLAIRPKSHKNSGWGRLKLAGALGHSWYGGDPLSVQLRGSVQQDYLFSARTHGDVRFGINIQNRLDGTINSSKSANLEFGLTRKTQKNTQIRYAINAQKSNSDSNLVQYTTIGADVQITLAPMIWDIRPSFSIAYKHIGFDNPINGIQRVDEKVSANLSLFFPKISYYGFAPTLNLSANRNDSSIDIYSTKDLRMSIGFNSTF